MADRGTVKVAIYTAITFCILPFLIGLIGLLFGDSLTGAMYFWGFTTKLSIPILIVFSLGLIVFKKKRVFSLAVISLLVNFSLSFTEKYLSFLEHKENYGANDPAGVSRGENISPIYLNFGLYLGEIIFSIIIIIVYLIIYYLISTFLRWSNKR